MSEQTTWSKKIHVQSSMQNNGGYAAFLGRWQPLHDGHKALFAQALNEGKSVCILIRDMPPNEKNPFTPEEVKANIEEYYNLLIQQGRVKVMVVPNFTSIEFGRGVGYDIIEHIPPTEIADISATKIREQMNLQNNK
jgi:nicotinamide mononucleotide adenylyltransferase